MTDSEYKESYDEEYIKDLLSKLSALGAKKSFITGVSLSEGKTGVYGYDRISGEYTVYQNERVDAYRHVLAVTFTNKATDEMKRRILKELYTLTSQPEASPYVKDFVPSLFEHTEPLRTQARRLHHRPFLPADPPGFFPGNRPVFLLPGATGPGSAGE